MKTYLYPKLNTVYMRITISGKAGSGKSTVAKSLAEKLKLKHYSIGDLMRAMAHEKKISLLELNQLAEKNKSIDLELDNRLKELGKKENNFIVDGRLTAFFIPKADVRIFLDTEDEVRAQRIMNDKKRKEANPNLKETLENIQKREESEKKRYREYYNVDYRDRKLYNCFIDTTNISPQEVVNKVLEFVKTLQKSL